MFEKPSGREAVTFCPIFILPMKFAYDQIHEDLSIPRIKSRAKKIAKTGVLSDYVTPIGEALLQQDDERFAFYVLEAAEWIRQFES